MISGADVERFIELVEQVRATQPSILDDMSVRALILADGEVPSAGEYISTQNWLYQVIRSAVVSSSKEGATNLRQLKSALYRRSRFLADASRYDAIPATILHGVNERYFAPLSETDSWARAIRSALALNSFFDVHREIEYVDQRDVVVTETARRWRDRGYRVRLDGLHFAFEEGEDARAAEAVNDMARRIGGQRLIRSVLASLNKSGYFVDGRFSIPRAATEMPILHTVASLPYGYIIQLAARHMRSMPMACPDGLIDSFVAYATDMISMLDVEVFSAHADMSTDHANLTQYARNLAVREFCFNFRQIRPNDALFMLENLFQWISSDDMKQQYGWVFHDALKLMMVVLDQWKCCPINTLFRLKDVSSATGLHDRTIKNVISSFSHRTNDINSGFTKPSDAVNCNLYRRPFIWQPGDKVLLTAPSIGAVGFIEAMLDAVRAIDTQADSKTGLAIESMLAEAFRRQGIEPTVVSMKYMIGKKTFDCDLLIETTDKIFLFEVKKKSLTNASLAGDPLNVLIDLCYAMVKAQTQLLHHEQMLARAEGITFENDLQVRAGNRQIEKIAVTLFDWGVLQDRMVSDTLIKLLAGSCIHAGEILAEEKNKINEINELIRVMTERSSDLNSRKNQSQPFFDCAFIGVPQILFMLDGVKTIGDFVKRFYKFKHVSVFGFDMYRGLSYCEELNIGIPDE